MGSGASRNLPPPRVQVTAEIPQDADFRIGTSFHVRLQLKNLQATHTSPNTRVSIRIFQDSCFLHYSHLVGQLAPNAPVDVHIHHEWKQRTTFGSLPSTIEYEVTDDEKTLGEARCSLQMNAFLGEFMSATPINILLWGECGAGKTSFLQTVSTAWASELETKTGVAPTAVSSTNHVTTFLKKYPLEINGNASNINLIDPWGFDFGNYQNQEFARMLRGEYPDGWEMGAGPPPNGAGDPAMKVHGVIILVPANVITNPSQANLTQMAQFRAKIDACLALKLSPIFVITQADKHVGAANSTLFRADPTSPVCAAAIKDLMSKAAVALQTKQNVMFAGVNYTDEKERCFEIDRLACQIMKRAIDGAKEFIKAHAPQH